MNLTSFTLTISLFLATFNSPDSGFGPYHPGDPVSAFTVKKMQRTVDLNGKRYHVFKISDNKTLLGKLKPDSMALLSNSEKIEGIELYFPLKNNESILQELTSLYGNPTEKKSDNTFQWEGKKVSLTFLKGKNLDFLPSVYYRLK